MNKISSKEDANLSFYYLIQSHDKLLNGHSELKNRILSKNNLKNSSEKVRNSSESGKIVKIVSFIDASKSKRIFLNLKTNQNFESFLRDVGEVVEVPNASKMLTRCQFHQHFTRAFFVRKSFEQLFSAKSLALNKLLYENARIKCWWNRWQVSISSTFDSCIFRTKGIFCQNVTREGLHEALLYKKCARKMLMKLTVSANFINVVLQQLLSKQILKVQKRLKTWLSLCAFGICAHKSCS